MLRRIVNLGIMVMAALLTGGSFFLPALVFGHCDTMEGPVVTIAKKALEKGDVTPVLKWVKKENENQIRDLFVKTLIVRAKGPEAKELADMYFFETLVRLHRAGEGAPYTGLKSTPVEPIVALTDQTLETGNVDELIKKITIHAAKGIKERFEKAVEKKKFADQSVEAGREYVEAYVQYLHYVENMHTAIMSVGVHHEE